MVTYQQSLTCSTDMSPHGKSESYAGDPMYGQPKQMAIART
jgi:hypothetical protein